MVVENHAIETEHEFRNRTGNIIFVANPGRFWEQGIYEVIGKIAYETAREPGNPGWDSTEHIDQGFNRFDRIPSGRNPDVLEETASPETSISAG